jgi:hypothetical protein
VESATKAWFLKEHECLKSLGAEDSERLRMRSSTVGAVNHEALGLTTPPPQRSSR